MATIGNGGLSAGHGDLDYIGGTTRVSSVQLFPYADSSVSIPLLGYSPTWDGIQFVYKPATTMTPLYAGIDGTNNDYDPGDEYQQLQLHNISGADATLTGMARGVLGKLVVIQWNGDHSLIIQINNAGSQIPNRFWAYSSSADIVMKSGQSIALVYGYLSATGNTGWLVLGQLNDAPLNSTAATTLTVSSVAGSGTSISPSRQDHVHAITSSSNPGAAAAILATNASGFCGVIQPGARAYHNANQSIGSGAWTALALNSERWDTDSCHDTVTNNSRLTCNTAGVYNITGAIVFDTNTTAVRGISIRLNGTTYIAIQLTPTVNATYGPALSISTDYKLAATDYVELMAWQDSGGNLNVVSLGNYTPEFAMVRIST